MGDGVVNELKTLFVFLYMGMLREERGRKKKVRTRGCKILWR
jgi:hypothetical protein